MEPDLELGVVESLQAKEDSLPNADPDLEALFNHRQDLQVSFKCAAASALVFRQLWDLRQAKKQDDQEHSLVAVQLGLKIAQLSLNSDTLQQENEVLARSIADQTAQFNTERSGLQDLVRRHVAKVSALSVANGKTTRYLTQANAHIASLNRKNLVNVLRYATKNRIFAAESNIRVEVLKMGNSSLVRENAALAQRVEQEDEELKTAQNWAQLMQNIAFPATRQIQAAPVDVSLWAQRCAQADPATPESSISKRRGNVCERLERVAAEISFQVDGCDSKSSATDATAAQLAHSVSARSDALRLAPKDADGNVPFYAAVVDPSFPRSRIPLTERQGPPSSPIHVSLPRTSRNMQQSASNSLHVVQATPAISKARSPRAGDMKHKRSQSSVSSVAGRDKKGSKQQESKWKFSKVRKAFGDVTNGIEENAIGCA